MLRVALSWSGAFVAAFLVSALSPIAAVEGRASTGGSPVVLSTDRLAVGTRLTLSGVGCRGGAGGTVEHLVGAVLGDPTNMATVNADAVPLSPVSADGSWSITTTLGQPMPTGRFVLVARCVERSAPAMESTLFVYEPAEVTTTSPPVEGLSLDGYDFTMDNPCRGITASPPFGPEASAVLLRTGGEAIGVEQVTALETDSPKLELRASAATPPGAYDLQVTCLRHRVPQPVRIVRSSVTLQRDTSAPASAPAAPIGAEPLSGRSLYTG